MELLLQTCRVVSMVAFLGYGAACLVPGVMNAEFERYGLPRLRVLTGSLEVAGALGLMAGHRFPTLGAAAAGGLALLMICGLLARLRIRDPFTAMLPATVLMLLNGLLALAWFQRTELHTLSMISSKPVPHTAVSLPINQVSDSVPPPYRRDAHWGEEEAPLDPLDDQEGRARLRVVIRSPQAGDDHRVTELF